MKYDPEQGGKYKDIYDMYPVTIVMDRYGGCYSGAGWIAFNSDEVLFGVGASDMLCHDFWMYDAPQMKIGKGATPSEAWQNLWDNLDDVAK